MTESRRASPFTDLASVHAWDAWFRWRDQAVPRDATIEDTWHRVATALASAEAGHAAGQHLRCMDALASWRLLPDERLLRDAGTGRITWRDGILHAVLNAAAFVPSGSGSGIAISLTSLTDCATLAVRVLDNAALLAGVTAPRLRIGLIGIADALALLGFGYDSDAGRAQAASMARALTEGCFIGNTQLAAERGACADDIRATLARAALRHTPQVMLHDAARHGLRHAQLTAITSQPRLALLANDVADAADPLRGENHAHVIAALSGQRVIRSSGYALNLLRKRGTGRGDWPATLAEMPCTTQIMMRAVLQPWMDETITYPLLATHRLDEHQRHEARRQAALHGLGDPVWRDPSTSLPA
jgi:ribonucleoside-diphosphate reductase alpha chain